MGKISVIEYLYYKCIYNAACHARLNACIEHLCFCWLVLLLQIDVKSEKWLKPWYIRYMY